MENKLLKRDIARTALKRMEEAARTPEDFKGVTGQWDRLDKNKRRVVRRHEIKRPNEEMLHWDKPDPKDRKGKLKERFTVVIPRPLEHEYWRDHISGDFIDTIFDCPHELHEVTANKRLSQLLRDLPEKQKEVLYYSVIRRQSNVQIAAYRNQSDRNIRKTLALTLEKLRTALDITSDE